jgi:hypothetical protein
MDKSVIQKTDFGQLLVVQWPDLVVEHSKFDGFAWFDQYKKIYFYA